MNLPCKHTDLPTKGLPYKLGECRICWLYVNDSAYRNYYSDKLEKKCIHLGNVTDERQVCSTCAGKVTLKIYECKKHGKCTPYKELPEIACCSNCKDFLNDWITIDINANGLGDALLGLTAISGYKQENPLRKICYIVRSDNIDFIKLFTGPDKVVSTPLQSLDMNIGYTTECATKAEIPRWQRYCNNIGVKQAILPSLKEDLTNICKDYTNYIIISPFSTWPNREYPLYSWLTLENLLIKKGYKVAILDLSEEKCKPFKSQKIINEKAEKVISILLNSAGFIGNDSGLAHLSGILGKPTIALCGQTTGNKIFGLYKHVVSLEGHLDCKGCWWNSPYNPKHCEPLCPNLASITPQEIVNKLDETALTGISGKDILGWQKLQVIRDCLLKVKDLEGDIAEFGVYKGGTARVITYFSNCIIHLYDTFEGMPEDDEYGFHKKGDFVDVDNVIDYVKHERVVIHKGFFPNTAQNNIKYKFVHVDADLYQSTKAALEYFVPRIVSGGIIVFDDYEWVNCPGVAKAIHEYLGDDICSLTKYQAIYTKK